MKAHVLTLAIAAAMALTGCELPDDDNNNDVAALNPTADTVILTDNGMIATINKFAPNVLLSTRAISGLTAGDELVGIDYRPADNKLYGLAVNSSGEGRIYTIEPTTGVATFKVKLIAASATLDPDGSLFSSVIGTASKMSVDFNPVPDRLRVITDLGQSLRINVDTGATITDGEIKLNTCAMTMPQTADCTVNQGLQPASVTSVAYTNSVNGTGNTELYDIDVVNDRLFLQNPPNSGVLSNSAPLGVDAIDGSAFDIDATNNMGYATLKVGSAIGLYQIDVSKVASSTAAATQTSVPLNKYFTENGVRGLALMPAKNSGLTAIGLSANNQLIKFTPNDAAALGAMPPRSAATTLVNVTGLATNETLVGIDYRLRTAPANVGVLYGLTRNTAGQSKIYTINTNSGAATLVSTLVADSADMTMPFTVLDGVSFAVDFNPIPDRLRVLSNTGKNYRINVDTGAVITDGDLNGVANAVVSAGAYTNSFVSNIAPPVATTRLFNLDQTSPNRLLEQTNFNEGIQSVVGNLGSAVNLGNSVGFDIAGGFNGITLGVNGKSLFTVNLATGAATSRGTVGDAATPDMIDIALLIQ